MNEKRFLSTMGNLNSSERKVLDVVPKQEHWPLEKIHAELTRTGIQMARDKVSGCIRTLVEVGLVKVRNRLYIHADIDFEHKALNPVLSEKIIPKLAAPKEDKPAIETAPALAPATIITEEKKTEMNQAVNTTVATTAAAPTKVDFMGVMAQQADDLRTRAALLEQQALSLREQADQLDTLAMQFGEYEQQVEVKLAKANQLQALLKSFQE